jgi:hypothetical protein
LIMAWLVLRFRVNADWIGEESLHFLFVFGGCRVEMVSISCLEVGYFIGIALVESSNNLMVDYLRWSLLVLEIFDLSHNFVILASSSLPLVLQSNSCLLLKRSDLSTVVLFVLGLCHSSNCLQVVFPLLLSLQLANNTVEFLLVEFLQVLIVGVGLVLVLVNLVFEFLLEMLDHGILIILELVELVFHVLLLGVNSFDGTGNWFLVSVVGSGVVLLEKRKSFQLFWL